MNEKKQVWKPGNMLYPVPAVMVSCGNKNGEKNIITIAGGHNLLRPCDGVDFGAPGEIFLCDDSGDR